MARILLSPFGALVLGQISYDHPVTWSGEVCEKERKKVIGSITRYGHGVTTYPPKGTCTIQNDLRICNTCLRNT